MLTTTRSSLLTAGILCGLLAFIAGCGGGGGGSTTGGGTGTVTDVKVEAVLDGAQTVVVDQTKIQLGDRIKFVLSGRNTLGQRVVVPSKDWGLSPESIGTLNTNTGVFVGSSIPSSAAIINGLTMLNESYGTSFYMVGSQAVGSGLQLRGRLEGTSTYVDLDNIQVGDQVRLVLTGKDSDGAIVNVPANWSTTAPGSVGTLSSGLFTAVSSSGTAYQVTGTAVGRSHTAAIQVKPIQALVFGRVRTSAGVLVGDVVVNFYNAGGTKVGTAKTSTDGTFRASVPTTAVTFHLDLETTDPLAVRYYRQYNFNGSDYAPSISSCRAPLPSLTIGASVNLATDLVLYRISAGSLPPPPPDGC